MKEIQWASTAWDVSSLNLVQVEAALTKTSTNPVCIFPCWGEVGSCSSWCLLFLVFFFPFWGQWSVANRWGFCCETFGDHPDPVPCCVVTFLLEVQHQEGFCHCILGSGFPRTRCTGWRAAPQHCWWQMNWPMAGFKWGKLERGPLVSWPHCDGCSVLQSVPNSAFNRMETA